MFVSAQTEYNYPNIFPHYKCLGWSCRLSKNGGKRIKQGKQKGMIFIVRHTDWCESDGNNTISLEQVRYYSEIK